MILIAAMSEDGVIGAGDHMPWNVPDEYQWFLDCVRGQTVIMGRRSWDIFGPDLTSRHNIVVSRSHCRCGCSCVVASIDSACRIAESLGFEVFCAGGASIYRESIDLAETMYLSTIKGDFEGDVKFPDFDVSQWRVTREVDYPEYVLRKLERIAG